MIREQLILKVLYILDKGDILDEGHFQMELEDFTKLLLSMQKDNLIRGVNPFYADDTVYSLDMEGISITTNGIEYLKRIHEEILKDILKELYDNRFKKGLVPAAIRKELFIRLKVNEVEAYLNTLVEKTYVKAKTVKPIEFKGPRNNKFKFTSNPYYEYWITDNGAAYYESDFQETIKRKAETNTYNISGNQVNIANDQATIVATQNNGIDIEELDRLVQNIKSLLTNSIPPEVTEVITDSVDALQEELKKDSPKKGIVKTAISGLTGAFPRITEAVELTAAVATIVQFAMAIL